MKKIHIISHWLLKRRVFALALAAMLVITLWAASAAAADPPRAAQIEASTPQRINYQGVVKVSGQLFNGTGKFKFAVVDTQSGSGTTNYWSNDGTSSGEPVAAVSLVVNAGLFNIQLGDTSLTGMSQSIDGTVFQHDPTFLRVWFSQTGASGTFEALEPNQRITSVAYALHAMYSENGPPGPEGPQGPQGPIGPAGPIGPVNPNADMVDGLHASTSPVANKLIALNGSAYLSVPRVLDSDNTAYYSDPGGSSNLNWIEAQHIIGHFIDVGQLFSSVGDYVSVNDGLSLISPGDDGVIIDNPVDDGFEVYSPGDNGIELRDNGNNGVYITTATNDGVKMLGVGDNGVEVQAAGADGIHIASAADDGLQVTSANYGVYIPGANTTGIIANGGTLGGYFNQTTNGIETYIAYRTGGTNYGILSSGTKAFVQEHPTDPSQSIIYAALEGGEAGTYYRGSAQLQNGSATVILPEHFSLVTEEQGLTVHVTPREDCNGLYVAKVTTGYIVVKELMGGSSNAAFDFFINGVRLGYAEFQVQVGTAELDLEMADSAKTLDVEPAGDGSP